MANQDVGFAVVEFAYTDGTAHPSDDGGVLGFTGAVVQTAYGDGTVHSEPPVLALLGFTGAIVQVAWTDDPSAGAGGDGGSGGLPQLNPVRQFSGHLLHRGLSRPGYSLGPRNFTGFDPSED